MISASATTILHSRQVRYKNDKSVEQAINELYEKAEQCKRQEMTKIGCSGCTKLKSLRSTGTQYIDTGVKDDVDLKFLIDAKINDNVNSKDVAFFGGWSGTEYSLLCANAKINGWIIQWAKNYTTVSTKDNNRHIHVLDLINKVYSIDDVSYNITSSIESKSDGTIFVYAANNSGSLLRLTSMNLYKFQIWKENTLIRDYIPVLDSDNIPCLFDKVSKTKFYNQGSGEFSYFISSRKYDLYDILGDGYYEINYLESTGTQYIDTGFVSNTPEAGYYVKYQNSKNHSGDDAVMGVLNPSRSIGTNSSKPWVAWKQSDNGLDYILQDTVLQTDIVESWLNYENNGKSEIKVNGTTQVSGNLPLITSSNNKSCYIFSVPLNSYFPYGYGNADGVRVYKAQITLNEELVRDYIPVLDSDNIPCLFDKVSKTCFYNKGTGEFLYG